MNALDAPLAPAQAPTLSDVIKVAVLAVGGQGGGVLTNWIADLAILGGYDVQTTSIAGVAQRTGSTIYYIEMAPKSVTGDKRRPVFAQSPAPGDVDIMITSELMEAGRAIMRGFVTPDRTTLITSSHRILAVSEKEVPGDGRKEAMPIEEEILKAARQSLCFDMERIAVQSGSVISSALFGALAKSGALPFDKSLFEEVIRTGTRGVEASLRAFDHSFEYESSAKVQPEEVDATPEDAVTGPPELMEKWRGLCAQVDAFDPACKMMLRAGLRKTVEYQDIAYGQEYLDHVRAWYGRDSAEEGYELTQTAAKYIAQAMCYDDLARVADLKIRAARQSRVRREQGLEPGAIVHVTEYFHPRAQEVCATLPARMGAWIEDTPWAFGLLDRLVNKGRRIRSDRLGGFLMLKTIAAFKPRRRKLLRHRTETAHLERLQNMAKEAAKSDYQLAIELLKCQRLIKGYSDTHARGHSKFDKVTGAMSMLGGRKDAAEWIARLREAALLDEKGQELDGALKTIASFAKA